MLCLSKWVHEPGPSSMMPTILGRRIVVLNTHPDPVSFSRTSRAGANRMMFIEYHHADGQITSGRTGMK